MMFGARRGQCMKAWEPVWSAHGGWCTQGSADGHTCQIFYTTKVSRSTYFTRVLQTDLNLVRLPKRLEIQWVGEPDLPLTHLFVVELRTGVPCLDLVSVVSRLGCCSWLWYGCCVVAAGDRGEDVLLVVDWVAREPAGLRVWCRGSVCQWHSKASCGKRRLGN